MISLRWKWIEMRLAIVSTPHDNEMKNTLVIYKVLGVQYEVHI